MNKEIKNKIEEAATAILETAYEKKVSDITNFSISGLVSTLGYGLLIKSNIERTVERVDGKTVNIYTDTLARLDMAHQIGHAILHLDMCYADTIKELSNDKELEADYFARCLLLPATSLYANMICVYYPHSGVTKVQLSKMAELYNVTIKTMRLRLEELNLCQ
jgi:hypothetical protein